MSDDSFSIDGVNPKVMIAIFLGILFIGGISISYNMGIEKGKEQVRVPTSQIIDNIEFMMINTIDFPYMIQDTLTLKQAFDYYLAYKGRDLDVSRIILKDIVEQLYYTNVTETRVLAYFQFRNNG